MRTELVIGVLACDLVEAGLFCGAPVKELEDFVDIDTALNECMEGLNVFCDSQDCFYAEGLNVVIIGKFIMSVNESDGANSCRRNIIDRRWQDAEELFHKLCFETGIKMPELRLWMIPNYDEGKELP